MKYVVLIKHGYQSTRFEFSSPTVAMEFAQKATESFSKGDDPDRFEVVIKFERFDLKEEED